MSRIQVRYWAAARDAAGLEAEHVDAEDLADALDALRARHSPGFARVLGASSLLIGGVAVGHRDPRSVPLTAGDTVEVLPPFAGG